MTVLLSTLLGLAPLQIAPDRAASESPSPLVDYGSRQDGDALGTGAPAAGGDRNQGESDDGRQDDPIPPRRPPGLGDRGPQAGPRIEPGVLPEDTSPESRALWELLIEATQVPDVAREPIESFVMRFDGTIYPRNGQRNRFRDAKYSYLAPRSIISYIPESSTLIRGSEGDWLKTKDNELVSLNDRTAAQDRKQLDDTLAIARNLVNFLDPGSLRIEEIGVIARAPALIPKAIREAHPNIEWLHMTSPDLRLSSPSRSASTQGQRKSRAFLGLDRGTHLPSLAVVYEDVDRKADLSNARLLILGRYAPRSGYRIPTRIHVHGPDHSRPGILAFRANPELELVMRDIDLRPRLTAEMFLPR